jgi:hypothetical protein
LVRYLRVANSTPMVLLLSKLNLRGGEVGGGDLMKLNFQRLFRNQKKQRRQKIALAHSLRVKRESRFDLPTPLSPISTT